MSFEAAIFAWSTLALVTTLSPGPDVLLVLGHAGRSGTRAGIAAALGIVCGGLYYMALFGLGLLQLLMMSPVLFTIVKLTGAAYLAWLGVRLLREAWQGSLPAAEPVEQKRWNTPFVQGLVTNALNPKVGLFYLAALPLFIGSGDDAALRGTIMIAIHYAMGAVFLIGLALFAGRIREYRPLKAARRWLEGTLGAVFLLLAGKLVMERN